MNRILNSLGAVLAAALLFGGAPAASAAEKASPAKLATACAGHDGWTDPAPPAQIWGNTWYVGTCGISVLLVTGEVDGRPAHVLVDGGPAAAAPLVLANIRKLGFDPKDVRWIVATHEHDDHAGALAALKRATGAKMAALAAQKAVMETGKPSAEDPQAGDLTAIAPVHVDRVLKDGDSVIVGKIVLTAHATPVHAPGSTSWTWQSCDAAFTCRMIAYADSASTISANGYRFTDHPQRIAAIRMGLPHMAALPCDILLTPHPRQSDMMERFAGTKPLVDANACRAYAKTADANLAARLAKENGK
ncbi:beta-lactamase-like protein [Novosphingobium sp. Rr 2-17]|uniref:subclass B3 metallo-beta-lactamase n=1 Tax=Novosphingobium sp. Rr 2-17 TaxID=555793 RepID=UPI000269AABF|nr:subclass B3 metallo-beta-lactamase [Novosphingobium sp. Rr 2-17]EIZ81357.1 beta-lactamase-like protein [Novosphingobium sp. Rr 2-17]